MIKATHKHYRFFAALLGVIFLLTSVPFAIGAFNTKDVNAMKNASSEDKRIAAEISNVTGAKTDEIFRLKNLGRTWNEVLEVLKNKYGTGVKGEKDNRDNLLMQTGLDKETLEKLKNEGCTDEAIMEAKLLLERVVYQLQDIVSDGQVEVQLPKADTESNDKDTDSITSYQELLQKIDNNLAVYYMLKLKNDFGSLECALDEYLYSLQAGLDLKEYLADKEAYLKKKSEKASVLSTEKVITLEKIEEKLIDRIQKNNVVNSDKSPNVGINTGDTGKVNKNTPLPDVPKPDSGDPKPKNPADEIMDEIQVVNPIKY